MEFGGEEEGGRGWEGVRRLHLKRVRTTHDIPGSFVPRLKGKGDKMDYNLHAKYGTRQKKKKKEERWRARDTGRDGEGELSTVYFLVGSMASPFLQAMILIF